MQLDASSFKNFTFTPLTLQVFSAASNVAIQLRHEYFEAAHILLALLDVRTGAAAAAFDFAGLDRDAVRQRLHAMYPIGSASLERGEMPYGETGLAVLSNALDQARGRRTRNISTGDVLLGALAIDDGIPRRVLVEARVSVPDLTAAVRAHPDDPK
jgi:ATP-dependent Clp protease ATP-binding subunit ClpA